MSEWKPGDVARVQYGSVDQLAIVRPRREAADRALEFAYVSGGCDPVADVEKDARRLVVIDPEDNPHRPGTAEWADWIEDQYSEQTRPRVVEPTGLGAVVRDAHGDLYVRRASKWTDSPWVMGKQAGFHPWADIDAVEVLSEGVQP